jgi:L-lactate dehydrogenase complex protein LldG
MMLPDQRETVFARIREALRQPAPHRHAHHSSTEDSAPDHGMPDSGSFRAWLPKVGPSLDEQIALFAQHSVQLKSEFLQMATLEEAAQRLITLAHEHGWKRVATHRHPLAFDLAGKTTLPCLVTDPGYSAIDLEQCDAAITGCDALIAQTGSVMVSGPSAGGRALSVLPPHHIVIARQEQVLPDLTAALQLANKLYAPNWPSFLSFITGPSRTGDIERILVLGAHGPKKLTILLVP